MRYLLNSNFSHDLDIFQKEIFEVTMKIFKIIDKHKKVSKEEFERTHKIILEFYDNNKDSLEPRKLRDESFLKGYNFLSYTKYEGI